MKPQYTSFSILLFTCIFISCGKDKGILTGNYNANFWGNENYTVNQTEYNLLNIPLYFEKNNDQINVNDCSILTIQGDSIFGFICIDDSMYSSYPYISGAWNKKKKSINIVGRYSAFVLNELNSELPINGYFEIVSNF